MASTSFSLGDHWEVFIRREVESGRYGSASEVVRDGGWLVRPNDPASFAMAIERLAADRQALRAVGRRGRAQVAAEHLRGSACATLAAWLGPLMAGRR